MEKRHLNILIPQWQGGGQDLSTYRGAFEIKKTYFAGTPLAEVEVGAGEIGPRKNRILGYDHILKQLLSAKDRISQERPDTIFTIGGGCDADLTSISYLNRRYGGDLSLVYIDAHGDLNTPETSQSGLFYGMPLRALLGEGDAEYLKLISPLTPEQVTMIGVRDLDRAEEAYIDEKSITVFSVEEMEADVEPVVAALKKKGHGNLYVHIDLDVLDPSEYSAMPLHVPGGLKCRTLTRLLHRLRDEFHLAGLGLLEYSPSGETKDAMLEEIIGIGRGL